MVFIPHSPVLINHVPVHIPLVHTQAQTSVSATHSQSGPSINIDGGTNGHGGASVHGDVSYHHVFDNGTDVSVHAGGDYSGHHAHFGDAGVHISIPLNW